MNEIKKDSFSESAEFINIIKEHKRKEYLKSKMLEEDEIVKAKESILILEKTKEESIKKRKNKAKYHKFNVDYTKVIAAGIIIANIFVFSEKIIDEIIEVTTNNSVDKEIASVYGSLDNNSIAARTSDKKYFYYKHDVIAKSILESENPDYMFYSGIKHIMESEISDSLKISNLDNLMSELNYWSEKYSISNSTLNLTSAKTWDEFLMINKFYTGTISDIESVNLVQDYYRNMYLEEVKGEVR